MRPLAIAHVLAAQAAADFNRPSIFDRNCAESVESCENACYAVKQGLAPDVFTFDANPDGWEARSRRSRAESGVCNDADELARKPVRREAHVLPTVPSRQHAGGRGGCCAALCSAGAETRVVIRLLPGFRFPLVCGGSQC